LLLCFLKTPKNGTLPQCAQVKIHLASWLLSADTATNARASKAIGRRFYDDGVFVCPPAGSQVSDVSIESPLRVRFRAVAQIFREAV
jgi:hypothetical protein